MTNKFATFFKFSIKKVQKVSFATPNVRDVRKC